MQDFDILVEWWLYRVIKISKAFKQFKISAIGLRLLKEKVGKKPFGGHLLKHSSSGESWPSATELDTTTMRVEGVRGPCCQHQQAPGDPTPCDLV